MHRAIPRLALSVGLIAALLAICLRVPGLHRATVALLLVLAIVGLAKVFGSLESLLAALVGGIGFVYYFLPPRGFKIETFEDLVDLAAFVVTAIATSQLVARSRKRRIEAEEQKSETEKLYALTDATLGSSGPEFSRAQLANQLAKIFAASGVALYDKHSGLIVRAGLRADAISEEALRYAAVGEPRLLDNNAPFFATPIHHGGDLVGSVGMIGVRLSESLEKAVADRIGLGLARLYAIEKSNDSEVVCRAEELKSAVLDAMAHEIRNPLNSIKIAATTLLSEHAGSELHKREMLTIIDEEADRMDRFIDEAVQISHVEANGLLVKKKPQNLAQLILAAIEEMGAMSERPMFVSIPESLPAAECDRDMIVRVLNQLLGNALKYSPRDSPLDVSAQFEGAAIVIDVVDSGPGVASEERDRIFEPYYRGHAASGTKGTGLGLASARSIVRAHGGDVWVTSPPGGGAAFHVSLPVTAVPVTVAAETVRAL